MTKVEAILKERDVFGAAYSGITEHTPVDTLTRALDLIEEYGVDFIVSLGGGSCIDGTKAIIFKQKEKSGKYLSHFAIPTTLSAAEYTVCAC